MSHQSPKTLLWIQAGIVLGSLLCFPLFARMPTPLHALLFSFLAYWLMLGCASFTLLLKDPALAPALRVYFTAPQRKWPTALNFIPVAGTLFVVFLPALTQVTGWVLPAVILIALCNGMLEEFFWRGITLAKYADSWPRLATSTLLFTLFHFAFLWLPLHYHGGAVNLLGGSAFMGVLWLCTTRATRHLPLTIFAHILVNVFAFTGLFLDNKLF